MQFNAIPPSLKAEWSRLKALARNDHKVTAADRSAEINRILLQRCCDIPAVANELRRQRRPQDIKLSIAALCLATFAGYNILSDGFTAADPPSGPIIAGCQVSNDLTQIAVVHTAVTTSQDILAGVIESVTDNCSPAATEQVIEQYNPTEVAFGPDKALYLTTALSAAVVSLTVPRSMAPPNS